MPLSKDILGLAVHTVRQQFNGKTYDELIAQFGTIENARLQLTILEMEQIILHISQPGIVSVTVVTAGTPTAHTGSGTGKLT